jgi:ABC-type antimicrobial peptide transport system permease subunit
VGIPIIRGREFVESDNQGSPKVAIVNESFLRTFKLGDDVLGRRMSLGSGNTPLDIEIVGVVRDARYSHIKEPVPPQFYLPYDQIQRFGAVNFYVRSTGPLEPLLSMVPRLMTQIDRTVPLENLRTMHDQVRADSESDRSLTILSASFALLAVLLASVGLHGVLSYSVAQRRKEMGVRMALGANARRITRLVLGEAMRVTFAGGLVGCAAALGLGTLARSMLFGVESTQLSVIAGAAFIVTSVAVMATVMPARRAARVNPNTALRTE